MCFSAAWLLSLCVWIVIVIALISILRLVIPWLASWAGLPSIILQIINIAVWAIVAIAALYVIFDLLGCLFGSGGFRLLH